MPYDTVIVGGGPSGLAAALALGRARKRVLVCDAGPRRNARAERIHNFVTRDGTPPEEFRRIGREQLAAYPNVEHRADAVVGVSGSKGAFRVDLGGELVDARRLLICTGMVDEALPIEGFDALWGHSIFQCPYCHGWEARDRQWGYLASPHQPSHAMPFAIQLRGWTRDVTLFTGGLELPADADGQLKAAGVKLETAPVTRLVGRDGGLQAVELSGGGRVACDVLFAHPPQHQTRLVQALDLALDDDGFVQVDPMRRETSVPGIYAAGDLTTRMQAAIAAAASGVHAAAAINLDLTTDLALRGEL